MNRRELLSMASLGLGLGLAGCAGASLPAVPVEVKIPENLSTLIDDVNAITSKVSSINLPVSAASWFNRLLMAGHAIATSKALADVKSYVSDFSTAWAEIKPLLPSSGTVKTIATAVDTVMPEIMKVAGLVSMFVAERPTGMTLVQARAILHS